MQIKEVARKLNTTPRTIRFYEEKGLITPKKNEGNDYRLFTDEEISRLSTILTLREIGVPIREIKKRLENKNMTMSDYLNIQRSALYEQWIEMKDMITTIDRMIEVEQTDQVKHAINNIYELAQHLKNLKKIRKNWQDKWDFDSWAADFDHYIKRDGHTFNVHQDYDEALNRVINTIELASGETCVDIGTGTGNLGAKLLSKGVHVIGIDQSEQMLMVCKEKHPAIETRKGHFLALPLMDNQVDGIISSYALHHLTDNEKLLALEEMTRVLKSNGQICIADLMFVNKEHRQQMMETYRREGNTEAIYSIEDEYYGDRSKLVDWLMQHDYIVETYQFNNILSMIYAKKK
ncbi:MerR family transcriptional regulator [Oceanobacillus chungangensis]|uniref:Transcriptional regulator n=1 Tax=Oceanobacillus chungangensis TaxID=1229152 RepID=A0A3D8PXE5_9BACI|nr:MerR family transcriptional regulator [Oceanobacillus chungangensis]RDW20432.1 transcriptional regulator [Oceanobacillus chungangensis]